LVVAEGWEGEVCPREGRVLLLLVLVLVVVVVCLKALRASASIVGESGVGW
jgi:hypothetical protein